MLTKQKLFTFIIILCVLAFLQPVSAGYQAGDTAANFTAKIYGTNTNKTLYSYAGNIIVLDFFAYWCGPCRTASSELEPYIQQYYHNLGGNPDNIPVKFISMNIDFNNTAQTNAYIAAYGLQTVLDDRTGAAYGAFGSGSIPQIAIINGAAGTNFKQWEVLYNQSGYSSGRYHSFRDIINSVQSMAPAGTLKTTITPIGAVRAGARWNVDGGPWKSSDIALDNLSPGTHTVNYKAIDGWWMAPPSEQVTITEDHTTTLNRTYRNADLNQDGSVDIMDFVFLAKKWQLTGSHQEDFDFDGHIQFGDIMLLAQNWLEEPIVIPRTDDDFETGDFSALDWIHVGDANWKVVGYNEFQGQYCAKSGTITDDQGSQLQITLDCSGFNSISFARKVSSEYDWDFFVFYIDNEMIDYWSGNQDWQQQEYPVSPGTHTFTWLYIKDESFADGSDCAWIDNVILL